MIGVLDFRVCQETVRAARASFAALSSVLSNVALPDALAERLRVLAPGGQAAAGLMRVAYEPFKHGAVAIIEARLTPGDLYLDFVAALISECRGLHVRHDHGWPVLSLQPVRASDACGVECMTTSVQKVAKPFSADPKLLRATLAAQQAEEARRVKRRLR